MAHLWTKYPGMLLVTPTTACAGWRIHDSGSSGRPGGELRLGLSDGDKTIESMRYVWMANFLGLPSISVPAGYVNPPSSSTGGEGSGEGISNLYKNLKNKQQQIKKNKDDDDDDGNNDGMSSKSEDRKAKIPVGLMATGEWAGEKGLVEFGVAAERLGLRWRERPAGWVDVVGLAREERNWRE